MFEPKENAITYYVKVGGKSEAFALSGDVLRFIHKNQPMSTAYALTNGEAEVKCMTLGGAMWRLEVREKPDGWALDTRWEELKGGESC